MTTSSNPVLLSLKPQYWRMVCEGKKTAELRRRPLLHLVGRSVFVYASSPSMELMGGFTIGEIWSGTLNEVWPIVSGRAGVDQTEFRRYFSGLTDGFAFEIKDVWELKNPLKLSVLKKNFGGFVAPQSWRYLTAEEFASFSSLTRDLAPA